jgi:hypothetical protein
LAPRQLPSESQIDKQAAEDGDAWSDADLAEAEPVYPPPSPEEFKALRLQLKLGQRELARLLGLSFGAAVRARYPPSIRARSGPAARCYKRSSRGYAGAEAPNGALTTLERTRH